MHILFFLFSMSAGGAERFTANMANHWVEKGHDVSVVTLSGIEADGYDLDPRVRRKTLNLDTPRSSFWSALSNNVIRVRALNSCLRELQPDVAIGIMSTGSVLLALARKDRNRIDIGTERSYPPSLPIGKIWHLLRRFSYKRLDQLVAQTEEGKVWLIENTTARTVDVIPNPVTYPLPRHSPYLMLGDWLAPNRRTLLAVGRLGPEKGFDRLIDAFAAVSQKYPDWDLAIVGDGTERDALEQQRGHLGLNTRIFLPGRAGNVGDWYEAANLFALTSLFEGFPNVLIEAMAHGLPAISVDCNTGPRDVIRSGENGLLVPPADSSALQEALARLMSNDTLRHEMSLAATRVQTTFSIEQIAARWETLFVNTAYQGAGGPSMPT